MTCGWARVNARGQYQKAHTGGKVIAPGCASKPSRSWRGARRSQAHEVRSEGCDSRNNYRYAVVVQDLAAQWIQSYPCKTKKLLRKPKGACKRCWSRMGSLKSFTLTIPWNLAKPVKIFPGIIARRHNTDQKHMGLLKEQCAE